MSVSPFQTLLPGMPGAVRLAHELHDAPVLMHEIMAGDLAFRRAEPIQRAVRRCHAGIMQKDHVGRAPVRAFAEVRRRRERSHRNSRM